jgi:hypothetical protein
MPLPYSAQLPHDRPSSDENASPFPNDVTFSVRDSMPFDCASAFVSYKSLDRERTSAFRDN